MPTSRFSSQTNKVKACFTREYKGRVMLLRIESRVNKSTSRVTPTIVGSESIVSSCSSKADVARNNGCNSVAACSRCFVYDFAADAGPTSD